METGTFKLLKNCYIWTVIEKEKRMLLLKSKNWFTIIGVLYILKSKITKPIITIFTLKFSLFECRKRPVHAFYFNTIC